MAITANSPEGERSALSAALYDPKVRGAFYQALTIIILAGLCWFVVTNTVDNLRALNRSFGFGFLEGRAGFNLGQALIPYSSDSTNATALLVGLLNTLLISLVGIVAATIVGFMIGIGQGAVIISLRLLVSRWFMRNVGLATGVAAAHTPAIADVTNTRALGRIIYTQYMYLFEAAGLVLLVAMIGAIVLTMRHRTDIKRQVIAHQVGRKRADAVEMKKVKPAQGI